MTKNKTIFFSLILIILCVFIFIGYIYYSSRPEGRGSHKVATSSSHNPITDNQVTKTQRHPSNPNVATAQTLTKTISSIVDKTTVKQDYQPTETEKLFYHKVIESLKPKLIQINERMIDDDWISWKRKTYRAFPRREHSGEGIGKSYKDSASLTKNLTKDYEDSVSNSKQYYQEMIMNLQELIKQCPDSPYYPHYQETIELIRQMQKEDESFYDKYWIGQGASLLPWDVHYLDNPTMSQQSTVPPDEKINGYIHCIRYSYFYKINQYKMEFGLGDGMSPYIMPYRDPILSAGKLVEIGVSAVPSLLNILEDRKPIIVADDTKIPAVFYRYQDAAVEILQRMFIKAKQPFPIQLPEDQYFSGYLEKQTPEAKQKTISDIKTWVEDSMNNPTKPEEQTPISNDKK